MEAGQSTHPLYKPYRQPADPESSGANNSTCNWNSNGWDWNARTFKATRLNLGPSDGSRQFFPVEPENRSNVHVEEPFRRKGKRLFMNDEEEEPNDDDKSLSLRLGWPVSSMKSVGTKRGNKAKHVGNSPNSAVCQVDDCKADLRHTKDYLRKHKVCEIHSKTSSVSVGRVVQRFCQQCSRFHELRYFENEKKSCMERLEGHNRRRRKTHHNGNSAHSEQDSSSSLINLLTKLGSIQENSYDQNKDQNFHSQLLSKSTEQSIVAIMQNLKNEKTQSQRPAKANGSNALVENIPNIHCSLMPNGLDLTLSSFVTMQHTNNISINMESSLQRSQLVDIDLNHPQDCEEDLQLSHDPNLANGYEKDPQKERCNGGISDSRSTPSSLSSSWEGTQIQSCTDRILIKLFEKLPQDIPSDLRGQIILWLHSRPTDIESYMRPGCIILTIYLRLENSMWEELCNDLPSALKRLLSSSIDSFWQRGWICTKIRDSVAIAYNGEVVIDRSFHSRNKNCSITLIKPIAVSVSKCANFSVKGFHLWGSSSRLLCNMNGKCLVEQSCPNPVNGAQSGDMTSLSFHCPIPDITGRGFIEVEDEGLRGNAFPFIVAEEEVCSEIRTLETTIDATTQDGSYPKNEAMNFLHEMGWLLQRSNLKENLNHGLFPFARFRWLINFALENDWCAVVKKLLDILLDGVVDTEDHGSVDRVLSDLCLLHKAVRRNCRDMVGLLLVDHCSAFKPDQVGPLGLTPLHIAANHAGSEEVLDSLTDDLGLVGLEAWNTARDDMGLTPNDYATLKNHHSYITLIQTKLDARRKPYSTQLILDMPQHTMVLPNTRTKPTTLWKRRRHGLEQVQCKFCEHQKWFLSQTTKACMLCRPVLVLILSVAVLCVGVALLFRGSPEVIYVFRPFKWKRVKYVSV